MCFILDMDRFRFLKLYAVMFLYIHAAVGFDLKKWCTVQHLRYRQVFDWSDRQ